MAGLGVLLAGVLAIANRRLHVHEDPRIDEVEGLLPKSNCGACGLAGCRNFAEKVVAGRRRASAQCTVSSARSRPASIALLLGVDAGEVERRVARLACAGGSHVARTRARYAGLSTCRAAAVVSGGGKECAWGCLGLGDCVSVCKQGAITLDRTACRWSTWPSAPPATTAWKCAPRACSRCNRCSAGCGWPAATAPTETWPKPPAKWPAPPAASAWPTPRRA
jgi:Na+-translocating ferredoxin:NAD+ oxidoreductase RNF subunit RnfB